MERQRIQELSPDYHSLISKFESLNSKHPRHSSTSEAQFVQQQHVGFSVSKIVFMVLSILGIAMVSEFAVGLALVPSEISQVPNLYPEH